MKVKTARHALLTAMLIGLGAQFPSSATATIADLAIAIYNTPLDVYTNDYMPYTMFVTNVGPDALSSVVVSNTLPSGFTLVDATPAYTFASNTLTFNLGSLGNLAVQKLVVRAKPTNAGSYTISASVSSAGNTDPVGANNTASFGVNVGSYLPGNLTASLVSTPWTNSNNGLLEQWMQISNAGLLSVASARVIVTGLTNQFMDAAGTNNGAPFIISGSALNPGQTAKLLLQFFPRRLFPFTNSQLQPFVTPLAKLDPPPLAVLGTPLSPDLLIKSPAGTPLPFIAVEFETSTNFNLTYSLVYSDDPSFTHPMIAFPISFPNTASELLRLDPGPPITISVPTTNAAPRYYRVYLNP